MISSDLTQKLLAGQHRTADIKQQQDVQLDQPNRVAKALIESSTTQLGVQDRPQTLTLQAAIDGINEALYAHFGDNAIQRAIDEGIDVSPQATADRIVNQSTAFFSAYKDVHSEMSEEEALEGFIDVISSGIDKGFAEARDILESLEVLEGEVASNIDLTQEYVNDGLAIFMNNMQHAADSPE